MQPVSMDPHKRLPSLGQQLKTFFITDVWSYLASLAGLLVLDVASRTKIGPLQLADL